MSNRYSFFNGSCPVQEIAHAGLNKILIFKMFYKCVKRLINPIRIKDDYRLIVEFKVTADPNFKELFESSEPAWQSNEGIREIFNFCLSCAPREIAPMAEIWPPPETNSAPLRAIPEPSSNARSINLESIVGEEEQNTAMRMRHRIGVRLRTCLL
jgi:hypothetical protein